jgi:hypothetical protein
MVEENRYRELEAG